MGISSKEEPKYAGQTKAGAPNYRLDFWLRNNEADVRVKFSIWCSQVNAEPTRDSKYPIINNVGQTGLIEFEHFGAGTLPANFAWLQLPYRQAKEGEKELRDFVNSWTNHTKEKVMVPLDYPAICQGNIKSIYDIVGTERDTYVKAFLGVREGMYQSVGRTIVTHWTKDQKVYDLARKDQNTDFGITGNFASDIQLRPYSPTSVSLPPAQPIYAQNAYANPVAAQLPIGTLPPAGDEGDDLPF